MDSDVPGPICVVIDDREESSGLLEEVAARWAPTYVARLDVGDVRIGDRVVVERKTIVDLVTSLRDGRFWKQLGVLARTCEAPLLVIEGTDAVPAAALHPAALRGILLTLALGLRVPILRTLDVRETTAFLVHAAHLETRRAAKYGTRSEPPRSAARLSLDILGAIPGIGADRARRLLRRFGTARAALDADAKDLLSVDGIGPELARRLSRLDQPAPTSAPPAKSDAPPTPPPPSP